MPKKTEEQLEQERGGLIYTTHSGEKLTEKESLFIDKYLETGNSTESAKFAGYGTRRYKKEDGTATNTKYYLMQKGNALLRNPRIIEEIKYRQECVQKASMGSIASAEEIMAYLTRVVRGEEKDQFGLDVSISERTKAAIELAKRIVDIPSVEDKKAPQILVQLDWGDAPVLDADFTVKDGQTDAQVGD